MTTKRFTSREFNQDTGGAKRAAERGPVYITDRGRASHVLLTFESYTRLASNHVGMIELLAEPRGIEAVEFEIPVSREPAEPAGFH